MTLSPLARLARSRLASLAAAAAILAPPPATAAEPRQVRGTLLTTLRIGSDTGELVTVPLHGVEVWLKNNPPTTWESARVATDAAGRFFLPSPAAGSYRLHWSRADLDPLCSSLPITVPNGALHLGSLEARPRAGVLLGRALLEDGKAGIARDPYHGIDAFTTLELRDALGNLVAGPVRANGAGDWLIGGVPQGSFTLASAIESATDSRSVTAGAPGSADCARAYSIVPERIATALPNTAPRVDFVLARDGSGMVRKNVATGASLTVEATASDPNDDYLHYTWKLQAPGLGQTLTPLAVPGRPLSMDTPKLTWTVPSAVGAFSLELLVSDARGGHATGRVTVSVGSAPLWFAGTVHGSDGPAIAGATVRVNTQSATTNAEGYFSLQVPEGPARFLMIIEAAGHAPQASIERSESTGRTFTLPREKKFTINPFTAVDVTVNEGGKWGPRVQIGANLLRSQSGQPPTGPLDLYVASYSPVGSSSTIPGELQTTSEQGITPYAGLRVRVSDSAGNPYHIPSPGLASVTVPLDPALIADPDPLPKTGVPTFELDRSLLRWSQVSGLAATVRLPGDPPIVNPPPFPEPFALSGLRLPPRPIDPDLPIPERPIIIGPIFNPATCVRADLGFGVLRGRDRLRVTYLDRGARVERILPLVETPTIVTGLPPNQIINYALIDAAGAQYKLSKQVQTSGEATICGFIIFPCECPQQIFLSKAPPNDNGNNIADEFLAYYGINNFDDAERYYTDLGISVFMTLDEWFVRNGFNADGSGGDTLAAYLNTGDLQLGRRMSVRKNPLTGDAAYYVKNFEFVEQAIANDPAALRTTVAMEWDASEQLMRFFAFDAGNRLTTTANLDGLGEKGVPNLCTVCHGNGGYSFGGSVDLGARFIPFDLDAFDYVAVPGFSRQDQQPEFKILNDAITGTDEGSAIAELIQRWYASGPNQASDVVVPGWQGTDPEYPFYQTDDLYESTVRKSCRSCHITRDGGPSAPPSWATYAAFKDSRESIQGAVCSGRYMPQALATYNALWLDQERRDTLLNWFLLVNGTLGDCPPGL